MIPYQNKSVLDTQNNIGGIYMNNLFNNPDEIDIPLGLGMALTQNQSAFRYFARLSDERKQEIIEQTHSIESKREMKEFVDRL